ncbi:MAG: TrkH family potassium uptake protein [Erysipelotrichaceae bacterium]
MLKHLREIFSIQKKSPARKIALSFLLVIGVGTLLLMLPISNHDGKFFSFIDALFTATSATCVTGLVTVVTVEQFNLFGQIVLIFLMQIGGLGLMTLMAVFIVRLKNRLSMHDQIAMKEMLNQDTVFNMKSFLFDIFRYTAIFEGIGIVLLSFRMVPKYGLASGLFKSLFLSVSAFCNAGFDVLGANSLGDYASDPLVIFTIMGLIILGGLGFAVWFDIRDKIRPFLKREIGIRRLWRNFALHTKLVLIMTSFLIVSVAGLMLIIEYNNMNSIGILALSDKLMLSSFQSVTLRTCGFASMDLTTLHMATKFLMMIAMFIGGSPGGTAGGVKTTTFLVLMLFIYSSIRSREQPMVFKRTISHDIIARAVSIIALNLLVLMIGIFCLCLFEKAPLSDLCFEAVSAMATVGLSLNLTPSLSIGGKIVIILLMYIGRIGITTLLISLVKPMRGAKSGVTFPSGNVIVG